MVHETAPAAIMEAIDEVVAGAETADRSRDLGLT
jgi:hypothetical protein